MYNEKYSFYIFTFPTILQEIIFKTVEKQQLCTLPTHIISLKESAES